MWKLHSPGRSFFARMNTAPLEVTALADSGASHVLFQASAAHVLRNVEYSCSHDAPFAVLKSANHSVLTAIGRGILVISNVEIVAYIFPDRDLTDNLLGLLPFANMGCTTVFKPRSFHIFKGNAQTAILSGTRPDENSLWRVPIHSNCRDATDGIPPPVHAAGLYIEAKKCGDSPQDNATYICQIHPRVPWVPVPIYFLARGHRGLYKWLRPIPTLDGQNGAEIPTQCACHGKGSPGPDPIEPPSLRL
jgi:hypothetical protein